MVKENFRPAQEHFRCAATARGAMPILNAPRRSRAICLPPLKSACLACGIIPCHVRGYAKTRGAWQPTLLLTERGGRDGDN